MEELARVYARSLFDAAPEQRRRALLREQLNALVEALRANLELQLFLFSPYFSTAEKKEGTRRAIKGADPYLIAFLELLIEKHRTPVLFRIAQEFERLCAQAERRLKVELITAVELVEGAAEGLAKELGRHTGLTVELERKVDPTLIGGLVLRVGNAIIDNSIRARLERLRGEVASAA